MDNKDFMPRSDSWVKKRENGMLLTDYQIEVLKLNGINYLNYGSIKEILFEINEILEEEENDELEIISKELDERNYYNEKKN